MKTHTLMQVNTTPEGVVNRRTFLRGVVGGAAGLGMLGWKDAVALNAQELRRRGMACILLFLRGGPSQFETFDPKPGTANGGPTQAINTNVTGIQLAEGWTRTAQVMNHVALVRSMTNREGEHQRATFQMHTGYVPVGGLRFPSIGAIASAEIGPRDFDLPHFVVVGNRNFSLGSGFLGMAHAPLLVANANQMPANSELPNAVNNARFGRRLELMRELEEDFAAAGARAQVNEHRAIYNSAANMVRSPRLRAFDLAQEQASVRDRYGRTAVGQGCLLARRLVEAGVTFVEVDFPGWDTHVDNFTRTRTLVNSVDPAFAALVGDLRERGMLERTLVVMMGEFGRTPRVNANTGRDHFPREFSLALAGGGIRGGRVLGATSATGTDVTQRPVTVPDLFCTFCRSLGIDPRRENLTAIGRPIRIVDGGQPVNELFS